jgi:ubiquinone/menaquinone biosynthesis C-methylase UbiE
MALQPSAFAGNVERFSGFARDYDTYRPQPAAVLADVLTQLAGTPYPELVVDLGAGTGLSTRYWAERAQIVIGIDPTADMLRRARQNTTATNVSYVAGFSHQTGLRDNCAQIITCSQSLHWMVPQPTFAEAARILQPGGVFAAYDYDWPPTTSHWQAEAAYQECMRQHVQRLARQHQCGPPPQQWPKAEHLDRMESSGYFRYTKEVTLHHTETGNAARFIGLLLSQGSVMSLLKAGFSQADLGIDRFREVVKRSLGDAPQPWYWSVRVRLGIV